LFNCTPIAGACVRRPQKKKNPLEKKNPLGLTDRTPALGELTRRRRKPPAGLLPTEAARDALAVLITDYRIAAQAAISRPEAR
jgi:hypothetical protein